MTKKDMVNIAVQDKIETLKDVIAYGMGTQPSNACAVKFKANKAELRAYEYLIVGKTRQAIAWMNKANELRTMIGTL